MGKHTNPNYIRDWKRAHKDEEIEKRAKDYRTIHGRARNLYHTSKRRATNKGLEFTITREWIKEKLNGRCELTDLPFSLETKHSHTPSVDRRDTHQKIVVSFFGR